MRVIIFSIMRVYLEKASGRSYCRGNDCKKLEHLLDKNNKIIKGTTCAAISLTSSGGTVIAFYCEDCIEDVLIQIRSALDPNFKSFK